MSELRKSKRQVKCELFLITTARVDTCQYYSVTEITFYGSSFITNNQGEKIKEANRTDDTILVATFDLNAHQKARDTWGLFRDRRPDLYKPLLTLDGQSNK